MVSQSNRGLEPFPRAQQPSAWMPAGSEACAKTGCVPVTPILCLWASWRQFLSINTPHAEQRAPQRVVMQFREPVRFRVPNGSEQVLKKQTVYTEIRAHP